MPAIVHLKTEEGLGHFVVLHRVTRKGVVIADPARGVQKLSHAQFSQQWTGYVLLLTPEETHKSREASPGMTSPTRRFWSLLQLQRGILLEAALYAC